MSMNSQFDFSFYLCYNNAPLLIMHNAKQKQQVPEQKSVIKKFQGLLSES